MRRFIMIIPIIFLSFLLYSSPCYAAPFADDEKAANFSQLAQFDYVRDNAPFYTCWTAGDNYYIMAFDYPHYVGDLTITAFCQFGSVSGNSGFALCCVMSDGSIIGSDDSSIWYTYENNFYRPSSESWSHDPNTIKPLTYSTLWSVNATGIFDSIKFSNIPTFNSRVDIQLYIDSNYTDDSLILNRSTAKMQGFVSYDVSHGDKIINLDSVRVVNSSDSRDSYFIFDYVTDSNVNLNDVYYDFTITGTPTSWYNNSFLGLGANNFIRGNKYTKTISAIHPMNARQSMSFTEFYSYMNMGNPLLWNAYDVYRDDLSYSNWVISQNDYDSSFSFGGIISSLNKQGNIIAYVNDEQVIRYAYLSDVFITIQPYSIVDGSKVLFNTLTVNMAGYSVIPFQSATTNFSIGGNIQTVVTGDGTSVDNAITNSIQQTTIYLDKLDTDSIINQYNNAFDNVKRVFVSFDNLFNWIPSELWAVIIMTVSAFSLIAVIKFVRG